MMGISRSPSLPPGPVALLTKYLLSTAVEFTREGELQLKLSMNKKHQFDCLILKTCLSFITLLPTTVASIDMIE